MRVNWSNLITVISATTLVGVQVVALGVATGWALAGLLGLGDIGAYVLEALLGGMALAATGVFLRAAFRVEPPVDRGEPPGAAAEDAFR